MGRGKKERKGDETQETEDEERKRRKDWKREINFCSSTFYLLPSAQLSSDWSSWMEINLLYDHIRRHSIKLSRMLYWTVKHPLSVVLCSS